MGSRPCSPVALVTCCRLSRSSAAVINSSNTASGSWAAVRYRRRRAGRSCISTATRPAAASNSIVSVSVHRMASAILATVSRVGRLLKRSISRREKYEKSMPMARATLAVSGVWPGESGGAQCQRSLAPDPLIPSSPPPLMAEGIRAPQTHKNSQSFTINCFFLSMIFFINIEWSGHA